MSWPMIEVRIPDNASLLRALLHVNIDINRNIFCTHSSPSLSSSRCCSTEERSRSCLCLRLAAKVSIEPLWMLAAPARHDQRLAHGNILMWSRTQGYGSIKSILNRTETFVLVNLDILAKGLPLGVHICDHYFRSLIVPTMISRCRSTVIPIISAKCGKAH